MPSEQEKKEKLLQDLRKDVSERRSGYRERALAVLPHVCVNCGRTFEGKRLRELTVHHKDHNHKNNPPDGSNWELLCLYCHDHEHHKDAVEGCYEGAVAKKEELKPSIFSPFSGLDDLLK